MGRWSDLVIQPGLARRDVEDGRADRAKTSGETGRLVSPALRASSFHVRVKRKPVFRSADLDGGALIQRHLGFDVRDRSP